VRGAGGERRESSQRSGRDDRRPRKKTKQRDKRWEDFQFCRKFTKGVFAKRPSNQVNRAGGSTIFISYNYIETEICHMTSGD
jgi:sarcosine oxidase delta subunit